MSTTVVAIAGHAARRCLELLAGAVNVHAAIVDSAAGSLDRAVDAWSQARRAHVPYFVHDADPLATVADAWVRRFDGAGPVGELEVAVQETISRWKAGSIELPDFYAVLDADALDATRRHWFLGVLHRRAPLRVVPVARPEDMTGVLRRLSSAPWWPALDTLLDDIDRVVPDRVGSPVDPPCPDYGTD